MIGQYLSNNNENATVAFYQKFWHPNGAFTCETAFKKIRWREKKSKISAKLKRKKEINTKIEEFYRYLPFSTIRQGCLTKSFFNQQIKLELEPCRRAWVEDR
jgi:hypothetical protein